MGKEVILGNILAKIPHFFHSPKYGKNAYFSRDRSFWKKIRQKLSNNQNITDKGVLNGKRAISFRFMQKAKNGKIFSAKELISSRFLFFLKNAYLFRPEYLL